MALSGNQVDVRMGHAIDARRATSGSRCEGRMLLPFSGHFPIGKHEFAPPRSLSAALRHVSGTGGFAIMFRQPVRRLRSPPPPR